MVEHFLIVVVHIYAQHTEKLVIIVVKIDHYGAVCHSGSFNFKKQKHSKWNKNPVKASYGNSSKEEVLRVQNPQSIEDSGDSDCGSKYIICKKEIENNGFVNHRLW